MIHFGYSSELRTKCTCQWWIQDFPEECAPTSEGGEAISEKFCRDLLKMKEIWPILSPLPLPLTCEPYNTVSCEIWIMFSLKMFMYNLKLLVCNTQPMISHLNLCNLTSLSHDKKFSLMAPDF